MNFPHITAAAKAKGVQGKDLPTAEKRVLTPMLIKP